MRDVTFNDVVGQEDAKNVLRIATQAAEERDEVLGHVIIRGPSGHGKTTLAYACAQAMNKTATSVNGGTVKTIKDMTPYLSRIKEGDILFIDEIHRLAIPTEEFMYTAMEDWYINIGKKKKGSANTSSVYTNWCNDNGGKS